MSDELKKEIQEEHEHEEHDHDHDHEHHHDHDHEGECCCGHHHHDHDDHDHDHEHHHEHGKCCHHDHDHETHEHHHDHHHDHGHDHHHDHDHEHHHHHEEEKITVTSHEDAVIASIKISLGKDREAALEQLKSFMHAVGEAAEAEGGMVGHIKFFFKESHGQMLSMTDLEEIQIKTAPAAEFTAEGVAIVVGISPDQLEDIVRLHYPGAV